MTDPIQASPSDPCTIRPLDAADVATLTRWLSEPAMQAVLEDEPGGALAATRKVKALLGMDPVRDAQCGYMVHFQDRPIGFVHVLSINWISRTCEIDLLVEPASQNSLLVVWLMAKTGEICFDILNLRKAYGYIFARNVRSLRFFSRLMPVEATLVAGRRPRSGDEDVLVTAMTVESYRQLRSRYQWDDFIRARIPKSGPTS